MISARIHLQGHKELMRALKTLPPKVEARVLQKATKESMEIARRRIRAAAPWGKHPRSENSKRLFHLANNIEVSSVRRAKKGGKGAKVTTGDAFWGYFLEHGWRWRNPKAGKRKRTRGAASQSIERGSRFVPAQPWFFPAFTRAYPSVMAAVRQRVLAGLAREWTRLVKARSAGK